MRIDQFHHTAKYRDYDGHTAMTLALEWEDCDNTVIAALLEHSLPYDPVTRRPIPSSIHDFAWSHVVQYDKYENIVAGILAANPLLLKELATAGDSEGRQAMNIASPRCKRHIQEGLWFLKRYEILTDQQPHHKSETCTVHIAIDHLDGERRVALKFMKNRAEFGREISVRLKGQFDETYVVGILRFHGDDDDDDEIREEVRKKGFTESPYVIVMDAGERTLNDIITKEHIAGRDWEHIRSLFLQVGGVGWGA